VDAEEGRTRFTPQGGSIFETLLLAAGANAHIRFPVSGTAVSAASSAAAAAARQHDPAPPPEQVLDADEELQAAPQAVDKDVSMDPPTSQVSTPRLAGPARPGDDATIAGSPRPGDTDTAASSDEEEVEELLMEEPPSRPVRPAQVPPLPLPLPGTASPELLSADAIRSTPDSGCGNLA
jgi:hypothetical protein